MLPLVESRIRLLWKMIRDLNWYITRETYRSNEIRHDQIMSTRLYIVLLIISVVTLSIYFGFSTNTTSVIVENPTINTYNELQSEDLHEFSCPCSKTSLSFETFTSLDFTIHQVNFFLMMLQNKFIRIFH